MFQIHEYYYEEVAVCDSLESAQAWVKGMTEVRNAQIAATGGKPSAEYFYIVEVAPLTAQQVADAIALEVAELADYLA